MEDTRCWMANVNLASVVLVVSNHEPLKWTYEMSDSRKQLVTHIIIFLGFLCFVPNSLSLSYLPQGILLELSSFFCINVCIPSHPRELPSPLRQSFLCPKGILFLTYNFPCVPTLPQEKSSSILWRQNDNWEVQTKQSKKKFLCP